jgi:maltoporin
MMAAAQVAQAQGGFEYHGYLRSGVGMSRGGTDQVCFTPAGVSNGVKFRLGNECETYLEAAFANTVKVGDGANAPSFKTHILFAGVSQQRHDWESTSDDQFTLAMREAYVQASNVLGGTKPWAGKRFYRRQDIHILDYYIINNSGPGAGFEDIDVGVGKLHVAVTRNTAAGAATNDPAQTNLDYRLSDVGLAGGKLETLFILGNSGERGSKMGDKVYEKLSGWQLGLVHGLEMGHGNNRLTLQHGTGVFGGTLDGADGSRDERLTNFGPAPAIAKGNTDAADAVNDSSSTRLVEEYTAKFGSNISSSWVLLYQTTDFGGAKDAAGDDAPSKSELMLGTRPVYHLSKTAAVALEYGFTSVGKAYLGADGYEDTSMHKLTLAPQFSAGDGFWARPQLRFFVTYAQWNDEAKGIVAANSAYDDDTTGFSTGAQLEAWW